MLQPEERRTLIAKLIKMAESDGEFHDEEYDLIHMIAEEHGIDSSEVELIFEQPDFTHIPKGESQRISMIYVIYLMMMVDGEINLDEVFILKQMALKLGLPAASIQRLIDRSHVYPKGNIPVDEVVKIFQIHHN